MTNYSAPKNSGMANSIRDLTVEWGLNNKI